MGFSMGAVRVAYYAASELDDRPVTVVPISPGAPFLLLLHGVGRR